MAASDSLLPLRKRKRCSPQQNSSSSPVKSPRGLGDSSDSEPSRSRTRRRLDLSVQICKDFLRNACQRAEITCKFAHPHPSLAIQREKVTACADSLRNRCSRGRLCRYYHPPPHIQVVLRKETGIQEFKEEMVCRDFFRGRCLTEANECRYAHHSTIVCQDFLHGKCKRSACQYAHVSTLENGALQVNDIQGEVCRDFLRGICERVGCRFNHPPQLDVNQVEVCRDFLWGTCHRAGCCFLHPSVTSSNNAKTQH